MRRQVAVLSPSPLASPTVVGEPIQRRPARVAVASGLTVMASAVAVSCALSGRVGFDSDLAIVGLMAEDIERGKHPVFYYGSGYAGTLEPHLLSVLFRIFGESIATYRLLTSALFVASVLVVWAFTRSSYGERAGLFAGLYLAIAPPFFAWRMLTSAGAYASLFLLLALATWLLVELAERSAAGRPATVIAGLLGVALGLAWWQLPLAACFAAPLAAAPAVGGWRWRVRHSAAIGIGFVVGAFPWLFHAIRTRFAPLRIPELAPASPALLLAHVTGLARAQWAVLLGAVSPATPERYFFLSTMLAVAVVIALVIFALRSTGIAGTPRQRFLTASLVLLLVANQLLVLVLARGSEPLPRRLPPSYMPISRYLLPAYLGIAAFFGLLVDRCWQRRILRLAIPALWLAGTAWSYVEAFPSGPPIGSDTAALVARLEALHVPPFYASYWTAYRLVFVSGRRLIASPLGNWTDGVVRVRELADRLEASPSPPLLLAGNDRASFRLFAREHPVGRVQELGSYTLFSRLPPEVIATLRRCRCIPQPFRPGELSWLAAAGPHRIRQGDRASFTVELRLDGRERISSNVHLSYHWRRAADGTTAVFDGLRSPLTEVVSAGGSQPLRAPAAVLANVPPGEYDLVFALVDENVAWMDGAGLASPPQRVLVIAR